MAGDWIKIEKSTARKPEVLRIAAELSLHVDHAFGLCIRFWSWCDDHLADCHARSVTKELIDVVVERDGFADALLLVGWLQLRNGSVEVPNFDRHLSESAKKRALSGKRQQKRRHENVTKTSRSERDKSVTREEKRREELIDDVNAREAPKSDPRKPPDGDVSAKLFGDWNAALGAHPCAGPHECPATADLLDRIGDPVWLRQYPEALKKFPLKFFTSTGYPMRIATFLKPDTVKKILQGHYDHDANESRAGPGRKRKSTLPSANFGANP